jgi:hypothetical protein
MNSIILLTQIQHVALVVTFLGLVFFLFRKRRPIPIKAVHPILFISHLSATVFCSCLALRTGLDTEINLPRFWIAAVGAILGLLVVLLSYRALWFKFVEAATRPPWPISTTAPTPQEPEKT